MSDEDLVKQFIARHNIKLTTRDDFQLDRENRSIYFLGPFDDNTKLFIDTCRETFDADIDTFYLHVTRDTLDGEDEGLVISFLLNTPNVFHYVNHGKIPIRLYHIKPICHLLLTVTGAPWPPPLQMTHIRWEIKWFRVLIEEFENCCRVRWWLKQFAHPSFSNVTLVSDYLCLPVQSELISLLHIIVNGNLGHYISSESKDVLWYMPCFVLQETLLRFYVSGKSHVSISADFPNEHKLMRKYTRETRPLKIVHNIRLRELLLNLLERMGLRNGIIMTFERFKKSLHPEKRNHRYKPRRTHSKKLIVASARLEIPFL